MLKPIFIWQDKILKKVDPLEVTFLITEGNYTKICFTDKTCYLVRSTLSGAMKKLPPDIFIQTHRSYAVSVFFIDHIAKDHLIIGDIAIPISRQYYERVIEQLQIIR
ncbi:LytR/AlgR family response regulator transcription factor [Flavihumibacter profundi]|jgi:DNA-binding LytR/AlgR family response regulator|uniref:LytR/AlgR family response regulator transcription factor n=1 Tax=Flavihumibacter profundi TaxID=2716883 RepID=UPI001CC57CA1|nr:LytTR family DNA-binding domain-containing protein [Flavihumibacter profundi]MBZ5856853.1 LytTR family transcriptional regulator [Flavihumibacter profundi]